MFDPSAQFELQVCPNGRRAADEYLHQGTIWIEGRENSRYTLKFTNRSPNRVMVIFSVDGLDTIKGQPAGPNSDGYVVDANSSIEVPGWTLDRGTAAEFYFSKAGRSYVATSGNSTSNTGVIGAMVFREILYYQEPLQYTAAAYPQWTTSGATLSPPNGSIPVAGLYNSPTSALLNAAPQNAVASAAMGIYQMSSLSSVQPTASVVRSASTVSQDVGTGFGDATEFNTSQVVFNRANPNIPDAILAVYYNTAKNLQKMGIQIRTARNKYDNSTASPFPGYTTGCKPPPGWTP